MPTVRLHSLISQYSISEANAVIRTNNNNNTTKYDNKNNNNKTACLNLSYQLFEIFRIT